MIGELDPFLQGGKCGWMSQHGLGLRAIPANPKVRRASVLVERSDREAHAPSPLFYRIVSLVQPWREAKERVSSDLRHR